MPLLETSNPVPAVALMLAVKFVPAIVNVWFAEALPYVVVKSAAVALADVLLMVMDGEEAEVAPFAVAGEVVL